MNKSLFLLLLVSIFSCSPPRYKYAFHLRDADVKKSSSTSGFLHPHGKELTASASNEINQPLITTKDTMIQLNDSSSVLVDSLSQRKLGTQVSPRSTKEERRKVYLEKKKAYLELERARPATKEERREWILEKKEAYTEMREAHAATKDKRMDGFAIAGAIFLTGAILCLVGYPGAAIVFGAIGLFTSILGLKSRIWGFSLAALVTSIVILSFYIFLLIALGGSE